MEDGFEDVHWPKLAEAIDTVMLNGPSTSTNKISFEQMYSCVYKCVCRQQSEQLYQRLMEHVSRNLLSWKASLDSLQHSANDQSIKLVEEFDKVTNQYFQALSSIVPIFTYLNRFYVATKLETDIQIELLKLYGSTIADPIVEPIVRTVAKAKQIPFCISPAVVNSVLGNLHKINNNYSQLDPDLFSSHLSGVRAPMVESDLEAQRVADQQLLQQLRESGFESSSNKKRCINDLYVGRDS